MELLIRAIRAQESFLLSQSHRYANYETDVLAGLYSFNSIWHQTQSAAATPI